MAKRRKRRRPESTSPTKRIKQKAKKDDTVLCFQDVWNEHCPNNDGDGEIMDDDVVSNVFFELANAPSVSYRLAAPSSLDPPLPNDNHGETESRSAKASSDQNAKQLKKATKNTIVIQQDVSGAAETHTGGIVWETSYLLLNYLLTSKEWLSAPAVGPMTKPRTILEIGAGCGMLGLALHKAFELGMIKDGNGSARGNRTKVASRVVVTETDEVMNNLRKNLEKNYSSSEGGRIIKNSGDNISHELSVEELDWTRYEKDCAKAKIKAGSVDCIIGTDVVFSTRFVCPMLETMRFLSHPQTTVYLCLQERCRDSHELLLGEAIHYGFRIEDISDNVYNDSTLSKSCGFGRSLECKVLKFTVVPVNNADRNEKKKKEKKKSKL